MGSEISSLVENVEQVEIKNVYIQSKLNGMCLDVRGGKCDDGEEVKSELFKPKNMIKKLRLYNMVIMEMKINFGISPITCEARNVSFARSRTKSTSLQSTRATS